MANVQSTRKPAAPPFVVWQDSYSVGNEELDGHHKTILGMVNEMYVALESSCKHEDVKAAFNRLMEYADRHFAREEELMEAYGFPGLADHRDSHANWFEEIDRLQSADPRPGGTKCSEVLHFLKRWWVDHICRLDRQYASYLNGKPDAQTEPANFSGLKFIPGAS